MRICKLNSDSKIAQIRWMLLHMNIEDANRPQLIEALNDIQKILDNEELMGGE